MHCHVNDKIFGYFPVILFFNYLGAHEGARILAIPGPPTSHITYFRIIGESLMDKGHEVDMLVASGTNPKVHSV